MTQRILLDARFYSSPPDGITRYIDSVVRALSSSPDFELESLVRGNHTYLPTSLGHRTIHDVHPVGVRNQFHGAKVRRLASRHDVYHYPHFDLPLLAKNSVATVHDLKLARQYWRGASRNIPRHLYFSLVLRATAKRARAITVPSGFTKDDLIRFCGIESDRVFVTPHYLSSSFEKALSAAKNGETTLPSGPSPRPYVLYVGTNRPNKNLGRLLDAYAKVLASSQPTFDLVLVGPDYSHARASLLDDVEAHGLTDQNVRMIGNVPDSDLPHYYLGATAFAFPSTYEGFGIPLLEAMACGTPIIASNTTSLPEVAGEAAVYFDPLSVDSIVESMVRVMSDEGLRTVLQRRGFERLTQFGPEAFAAPLLEAYHLASDPQLR